MNFECAREDVENVRKRKTRKSQTNKEENLNVICILNNKCV